MRALQKSNQNQLEQLKHLLLEDELERLRQLSLKLDSLEFKSTDSESIKARVTPLLDEMLLSNLSRKDSRTIEILSEYLASVIQKSSEKDIAGLSHALQSVISPAISREIENNKDSMIDALYPIMGGMISKYVTQSIKELMENINKKIESGLSLKGYKRKIKAKLTGVSEAELLLEESSDASILSLFVIHKETGLLIAEAHDKNREIDDASMVASMADAIKDFVDDWMRNLDQKESLSEVQILSYGNATLYIESAGSVYMVAFMDSEPDYEQRQEIHKFFVSVLKQYSKLFKDFDGNLNDKEIKNLENELLEFLSQYSITRSYERKPRLNIAKYIFYILMLYLAGYFVYTQYNRYIIYSIVSEIREKTDTTVELKIIDKNTALIDGYITDMKRYEKIEEILKRHNYTNIINRLHMPVADINRQINKIEKKIPIQFMRTENQIKNIYSDYEKLKKNSTELSMKFEKIQQTLENKIEILNSRYDELSRKNTMLSGELTNMKRNLEQLQTQLSKKKDKQDSKKEKRADKPDSKKINNTKSIKEEILASLKRVFLGNPYYNDDGSLDFHIPDLFALNSTKYNKRKISRIEKDYEKYISTLLSNEVWKKAVSSIIIEGYTDSSGDPELNLMLSDKRASNIRDYLASLPISQKYGVEKIMISKGMGSKNPVFVDGIENRNMSRRIKMRFALDTNKTLEETE